MKIVRFDDHRVGVVAGEDVVDVTRWVPDHSDRWPETYMVRLVEDFDRIRPTFEAAVVSGERIPLASVRLLAPLVNPSKILAAPVNYRPHQEEMGAPGAVYAGQSIKSVAEYGVFLKPPSSLAGPGSLIELPYPDRRTDHEGELGVVIGRQGKNIPASRAMDYVFGYTCLLDITVRGQEDRTFRKGFDTFTPIGPWIVTRDEVPDPHRLGIKVWVNDDLRQDASTAGMIYDIPRLIELASYHVTLHPGDLLATGTPDGVGPIRPGDRLTVWIERVGTLTVEVAR